MNLEFNPTLFDALSLVVTVFSLFWAIIKQVQKRKLERFTKVTLCTLAGDIAKLRQSTMWAYQNVRDMQNAVAEMPQSATQTALIKFMSNAHGDTAAADRMAINIFGNIMSFQEIEFDTREIRHAEKDSLDLIEKEVKNNSNKLIQPKPFWKEFLGI